MIAGAGFFLIFEGLFFAANLTKVTHGAWLPLLIGIVVFTVMITWQRGRELVTERREHEEGSLSAFVDDVDATPAAAAAGAGHCGVPQPQQAHDTLGPPRQRGAQPRPARTGRDLDRADPPDPLRRGNGPRRGRRPRARRRRASPTSRPGSGTCSNPMCPPCCGWRRAQGLPPPIDPADVSYFLSTIDLYVTDAPGMTRWRKQLFLATVEDHGRRGRVLQPASGIAP